MDNRDQKYGSLIAAAAAFNNPSIPMIVKNVPMGIVAEVYQHKDGDTRGMISPASGISYPDVKASLPDPSKPITVSIKASGLRGCRIVAV